MNPEGGTATAAGEGECGWKKLVFGSSLPIDFFHSAGEQGLIVICNHLQPLLY